MRRAALLGTIAACVAATGAQARPAAVPQNTALPKISGTARQGSTLTASNGTWSNNPTSFAYQWQRCDTDGTGCGDLTGATSQTYTLTAGDVTHSVRVVVTASNNDGKTSATSDPSDIVASTNGPSNTVNPAVTAPAPAVGGPVTVGTELSVSNGTWTPTPSSFTRQWQRCALNGTGCVNVAGATGQTYGVRSADGNHGVRALVTAHTSSGEAATAISNTIMVAASTTTTTTATTTTPAATVTKGRSHKPPTLAFQSLQRVGVRIYARFRVCESLAGKISITERDNKARALPFTRRFTVSLVSPAGGCLTITRKWLLLARFRLPGRFLVTLRAHDKTGALSRLVSRSLVFH